MALNADKVVGAFRSGELAGVLNSGTGVPLANIVISFPMIWGHNLRAIVVILLLGLFSFGVLGTLIFLIEYGSYRAGPGVGRRAGNFAGETGNLWDPAAWHF